jgi:hypothetical protein
MLYSTVGLFLSFYFQIHAETTERTCSHGSSNQNNETSLGRVSYRKKQKKEKQTTKQKTKNDEKKKFLVGVIYSMHLFRSAACCSKPTKVIDPSIKRIPPLPSIPTPPPTGKCREPVDERFCA